MLISCSQVQAPLGNYQYPLIQTYSGNSPESVYLGATNQCPAWGIAATNYEYSEAATNMEKESADFYNKVHTNLLEGVWVEEYTNSYYANYVYDYANYMDVHDSSAASFLSQKTSTGISNLQQLKLYSDQQLNAWLGECKKAIDRSKQHHDRFAHFRTIESDANKYLLQATSTKSTT